MSEQRVNDTELAALVRDLHGRDTGDAEGYTFHRIQEGYADGVPRAVFVHQHEEPVGSPLGKYPEALLSLLGRLAADLQEARAAQRIPSPPFNPDAHAFFSGYTRRSCPQNARYVGITGFVSRAEVDACLAALPEGLTLMCGVLVSQKTLRGERNKWHRRYPRVEDIAGIFPDDPRCLNLIHYCSDVPPSEGTIDQMFMRWPNHHGFQFNGAWPMPNVLRTYGGIHVVLQLRPDGTPDSFARLREAVGALDKKCRAHVLVDGSGGRGVPIAQDIADAWGMMIRGHFGNDVGLGFAGGLDADYLPRVAAEVQSYGASIDAEGRLRDGDEGGTLNLDKARAYLRAAGEVMR